MNLRCLKLYRAYSIPFNSSNDGKFLLELNFKGLYQSSGREKESCCLLFPSSTKREIRQFHVVVVQRRQKNVQKKVMHVPSCCFADLNLSVIFCRSRCRRRRRCVNSLITWVRWCLRRKLPLPLRNIKFYFSHSLKQNDVKQKLVLIINFQRASHIYQHNLDHCQPLSTNKSFSYTALISDRPAIHFGIPRRTCIHEV